MNSALALKLQILDFLIGKAQPQTSWYVSKELSIERKLATYHLKKLSESEVLIPLKQGNKTLYQISPQKIVVWKDDVFVELDKNLWFKKIAKKLID